ncbi:MAG: DUF4388 domain-containing protein, partial [Calditerrivibrio sp.]|nr:DUF4388 domain-containing protein [Calditerrivibrio sp.]
SLLLGSNPQKTILNLIEDDVSIDDITFKSIRYDNFILIPAGTGITKLADLSHEDKLKLTNKIDQFKNKVDFFIIDSAAGASDEVVHFIKLSDILILVIIPEITSIKDAYGLLKILKDKGVVKKTYIVINKARSKSQVMNIYNKFEDTVKKFLEIDIELLGPIPYNPKITEAVNSQTPILYYEPNGNTASLFRQYANIFCNIDKGGKNLPLFLTDLMMLDTKDQDKDKEDNRKETKDLSKGFDENFLVSIEKSISSVIKEVDNIHKMLKINLRHDNVSMDVKNYFSDFQVDKELVFIKDNSYFVTSKILGWDYGNYIFVKSNKNIFSFLENLEDLTARYSFQDKLIEFKTRIVHRPSELDEIIAFMYPKNYKEFSLRGNKRYSVNLSCIILINNEMFRGRVLDINLSGALISSEVSMSIGDSVRLSFVLPDGKLIENIFCRVKNVRDADKYGVVFESISPLSYKRLGEFFDIYEKITSGKESIEEVKKTDGNLKDISVMDLVQVLSISNKTCILEIVGYNTHGTIYFDKGAVVDAACNNLSGLEAFYLLMDISEGEFIITEIPSNSIQTKSITKSTNQLLLDAAFIIDTKRNLNRN